MPGHNLIKGLRRTTRAFGAGRPPLRRPTARVAWRLGRQTPLAPGPCKGAAFVGAIRHGYAWRQARAGPRRLREAAGVNVFHVTAFSGRL